MRGCVSGWERLLEEKDQVSRSDLLAGLHGHVLNRSRPRSRGLDDRGLCLDLDDGLILLDLVAGLDADLLDLGLLGVDVREPDLVRSLLLALGSGVVTSRCAS